MLNIIFYTILGQPLVAWVGVVALLLMFVAATLGFLVGKGKAKRSSHVHIAHTAIVIALLHGLAIVYVVFFR